MGKVMWLHKENFKTTTKEGLSVIITEPCITPHDESQHGLFVRTLFWKSYFKIWGRRVAIGFSFFISFPFLFLLPPLDYLKSSMYWNNLQTLVELKKGITDEIRNCSA